MVSSLQVLCFLAESLLSSKKKTSRSLKAQVHRYDVQKLQQLNQICGQTSTIKWQNIS